MKSLLRLTTLLVALVGVTCLCAATYTGTVISVESDTAKVTMNGNVMPPVGARAEIFFKIDGSDVEVPVATGSALKIDHGDLLVKIESATGTVEKGQLVRFGPAENTTTSSPSPPAPSATPAPTGSLPPSIPLPTSAPKNSPMLPAPASIDPKALEFGTKGIAQYSSGDIAGSIASYTEAIRLAPNAAVFYLNRANAYLYKPDFRAAIADVNKALELKVEKPDDAYVIRGAAQAGLGNYDAGIADCNRALKINPRHAIAYNNRGTRKFVNAITEEHLPIARRSFPSIRTLPWPITIAALLTLISETGPRRWRIGKRLSRCSRASPRN